MHFVFNIPVVGYLKLHSLAYIIFPSSNSKCCVVQGRVSRWHPRTRAQTPRWPFAHTHGLGYSQKPGISFSTSQDFPLYPINGLSVHNSSSPSLPRWLAAWSSDARRHQKEWNGAFHFHNFNLKLHSTRVFTPVYISFCARVPVANTPCHLAKHTPKIQLQKIKMKKINMQSN